MEPSGTPTAAAQMSLLETDPRRSASCAGKGSPTATPSPGTWRNTQSQVRNYILLCIVEGKKNTYVSFAPVRHCPVRLQFSNFFSRAVQAVPLPRPCERAEPSPLCGRLCLHAAARGVGARRRRGTQLVPHVRGLRGNLDRGAHSPHGEEKNNLFSSSFLNFLSYLSRSQHIAKSSFVR